MKNFILLLAFISITGYTYGQAYKQLNFGIIGVSYEIPVATDITIAPFAGTNLDLEYLTLGVKANYYFDNLFGLTSEWDVYGGANAGFGLSISDNNNGDDFGIGLQVGGRWFWSEIWGLYVELGGGNLGGTGGVGVTMKL